MLTEQAGEERFHSSSNGESGGRNQSLYWLWKPMFAELRKGLCHSNPWPLPCRSHLGSSVVSAEHHLAYLSHSFGCSWFCFDFNFNSYWSVLKCIWFQMYSKAIQYIYILFQFLFHYRLLQDTKYSSLCCAIGSCCFFIFVYGSMHMLITRS